MQENDPFADDNNPFANDLNPPEKPPRQKMSGCAIAAIGCGGVTLLALIGFGLAALWAFQNMRELGADFAVMVFKEGLKELDIPDDQRERMIARMDDIGQQFKDEKINEEELGTIMERLGESPLIPAGLALVVKRAYIRQSGLNEDEKAAADASIQRFVRGVIDEAIPEPKQQAVLDLISKSDGEGGREFQDKLTDDELRAFVEAAAKAADEAGVPDDVPEINFADEFDKVVDEALGLAPSVEATSADSAAPEEAAGESPEAEASEVESVEQPAA